MPYLLAVLNLLEIVALLVLLERYRRRPEVDINSAATTAATRAAASAAEEVAAKVALRLKDDAEAIADRLDATAAEVERRLVVAGDLTSAQFARIDVLLDRLTDSVNASRVEARVEEDRVADALTERQESTAEHRPPDPAPATRRPRKPRP